MPEGETREKKDKLLPMTLTLVTFRTVNNEQSWPLILQLAWQKVKEETGHLTYSL